MKKRNKIVLCVLLAVLIAGGAAAYAFLPHSLNFDIKGIESIGSSVEVVSTEEDSVTIQKSETGDFRVLLFTDMHLDGKNDTSKITVTNLVRNIQREKPDLVLLGGDNVTSAFNKKRARQLAQIFENLGVYWGGIIGNHEGDNGLSVSRPKMVRLFSSYDHCLMLQGKDEVWGDCNYTLNLLNSDGKLVQTFVFMDTGDEVSEETKTEYGIPADQSPYDGTKTSQVEWYQNAITLTEKAYGKFRSTVLIHIPLPQMKEAAETTEFLRGDKNEKVCASGFDAGLFDAIKKLGSTKTVFFGHDHINDFSLMCDGILLSYMQPSGYGSYTMESRFGSEEKDWLQGYTLLSIGSDGNYTPEYFRNSALPTE